MLIMSMMVNITIVLILQCLGSFLHEVKIIYNMVTKLMVTQVMVTKIVFTKILFFSLPQFVLIKANFQI